MHVNNRDLKILLVDDFDTMRDILRMVLIELGYSDLEEASNGKQALERMHDAYAAGVPFDLIFCDWNMPEMTGIDVLRACRTDENLKSLPFIMVTAESEQESVVSAISAGATDYIIKPIAPDMVERKIRKILSRL